MAGQPVIRPHENHDLHMKWEHTWMESQKKQQVPSKAVPESGSSDTKSREHDEHTWFVVRLRIGPVTASLTKLTDLKLKDISHLIHKLALKEQKTFTFEALHTQKTCAATSKDLYQWLRSTSSNPSITNWNPFQAICPYIPGNYQSPIIHWSYSFSSTSPN